MSIFDITINEDVVDKLLNPEYPILKSFKEKAPGSFQHSESVSRLCEKIGRELKLNLDILKIIGLYHDIGKIRFPHYFCENQIKGGEDPHEHLEPLISYRYLTGHVADGIAILVTKVPEIPVELTRCIASHHGNSVLQSIYSKVPSGSLDEDLFRYPYCRPKDVYACALMIADHVEATIKAITSHGGKETPEEIIKGCIEKLAKEEQIDELKLREVRIIQDVLCSEYAAINHNRITAGYEEMEKEINNKI